jgi:hypothetical protein
MSDPPVTSEWIPPDTWCPGCLPDPPDALGSTLAYCMAHQPPMAGADDAQATRIDAVWNSGDATGENCRAIQGLIRPPGGTWTEGRGDTMIPEPGAYTRPA